ncbi:type II toxin-antitoxin system PemK/MazF family toxin [Ralstonia pickettii]|nr:type II toxin-antitoxin system PemK/MazF family toxin [Ralstonia pickettii]
MQEAKYQSRSELHDEREFNFGSVWKVDDRDIGIPQIDKLDSRTLHNERWVVVISNNTENFHPLCPIVTVAPLSHRVDLQRDFDLLLSNTNDNVKVDCLLQLKLSQPILKVDLFENQGEISLEKKEELMVSLEDFYGLTYE